MPIMIARTPNIRALINVSTPDGRFLVNRGTGEFERLIVGPLGIIGSLEAGVDTVEQFNPLWHRPGHALDGGIIH